MQYDLYSFDQYGALVARTTSRGKRRALRDAKQLLSNSSAVRVRIYNEWANLVETVTVQPDPISYNPSL